MKPAAPQTAQPTPATPTKKYETPRVQNLGAWQAVTLINSVPINPGGIFGQAGNDDN